MFFVVFVIFVSLRYSVARVGAQEFSQRGFVDGSAFVFPQQAPNDPTRLVGDLLIREEAFYRPTAWLQFAGGIDGRANTHDQVADSWAVDFQDRGIKRPRLEIRRASVTVSRGPVTLEAGKQFVRWGKTDIVTPTDRFAPRDFMNVVDNDFLAITAARLSARRGGEAVEAVWSPRLTPSRLPLFDQRWFAAAGTTPAIQVVDGGSAVPDGSQFGVRWTHAGRLFESAVSFYDGFNHQPLLATTINPIAPGVVITREYPSVRVYGADAAVPTRWVTIKGEAAYFGSGPADADEFVLFVVQLERQTGEWVLIGGYAGDIVTRAAAGQGPGSQAVEFSPERGLSRAIVGRASYTIDTNRSAAFEAAVRQNGDGVYGKAEFSQARGEHWRATVAVVGIGGRDDDFLGAYRRNSHVLAGVRYSF